MSTLDAEIYPEEFKEFFKAMVAEMRRHQSRKGDSWKQDTVCTGVMYPTHADYNEGVGIRFYEKTDKFLSKLLTLAVKDWRKTKDPHQLLDIANICGMMWSRSNVLKVK